VRWGKTYVKLRTPSGAGGTWAVLGGGPAGKGGRYDAKGGTGAKGHQDKREVQSGRVEGDMNNAGRELDLKNKPRKVNGPL